MNWTPEALIYFPSLPSYSHNPPPPALYLPLAALLLTSCPTNVWAHTYSSDRSIVYTPCQAVICSLHADTTLVHLY